MKYRKLFKITLVTFLTTFLSLFGGCSLFSDGDKLLKYTLLADGTYEVSLRRIGNLSPMNYGVKEISIPAEYNGKPVTRIAEKAFEDCDDMKKIEIPASINSIGQSAFFYCISLERVEITDLTAWCEIEFEGNTASNPLSYAGDLYLNGELITDLVIPNNVTRIERIAFSYCSSLTSVVIPDSVTSIGEYAFTNCNNLARVEMGELMQEIEEFAFFGCYSLVEVVNHSPQITITKLDKGGMNIYLENGGIGVYALGIYNANDEFTGTKISIEGDYIIYADGNEKILAGYLGKETDLVFPSNITKIKKQAFYENKNLTSVKIGESVKEIGDYAFCGCENLQKVIISDSVTRIGDSAFYQCKALTDVIIGDGVVLIGTYAFGECNLKNVTFKNTNGWLLCRNPLDLTFDVITVEGLDENEKVLEYFRQYSYYYWMRSE